MSAAAIRAPVSDAAGSGDKNKKLILKVTVEVSADSNDTILVYEGDQPRDLAQEFCRRNRLQDNLVAPLTAHILENLKKVSGKERVPSADGAARNRCSSRDRVNGQATPRRVPGTTTPRPAHKDAVNLQPAASAATPARGRRGSFGGGTGRMTARTPERSSGNISRAATIGHMTPERSLPGRAPAPNSARGAPIRGGSSRPGTPNSTRGGTRAARNMPRPAEAQTCAAGEQPLAAGDSCGSGCPSPPPYLDPNSAVEDGTDRFNWLHQDATQRRNRLDRLRQQVERDIEDQQSRVQTAPGSARCASWQSREAERALRSSSLGERLYNDAVQRRVKIREQQSKLAEQRLQEELSGATFSPAIEASQRAWQGVGRSSIDPEGVKTKKKIENMRQMKAKSALEGCTFHPEIDPKSELLMNQRIQRLKITGSLYDHLYEDAQRRQERQIEYNRSLPPGVTFQPDIGSDHMRPPNDDNKEDFVNRLAYSKCYSEKWLSLRRQQEGVLSQETRSQGDFHPQTGRAPAFERNKDKLPIGDFLYESGREKALNSQDDANEERSQPSVPKVGKASQHLFEESKQRMYEDLYQVLTAHDPDKELRYASISLANLDFELTDFLRPMLAYLKETRTSLDFTSFCAALEYQRQHSATPTAHLFVHRSRARTSDRYRQEVTSEVFTPRTDPNSNKIAARHRPRGGSTPLYEQLLREKEVWDSKLHEQRLIQEERRLQECTFQPNAVGRSGSTEHAFLPSPRSSSDSAQAANSDTLSAGRAIRLGGVVLTEPAASAGGARTPPQSGSPRRAANPVAHIISSLESQRDRAFVEGILQSYKPDTLSLDPCKMQIDEAEQAVAHCKTLLASSNQLSAHEFKTNS